MAFHVKTDFSGLTEVTGLTAALVIKDANENGSIEKYQPRGLDGSFLTIEVFGADMSPTNSFGIKAPGFSVAANAIKLNSCKTVNLGTQQAADNHTFALESFQITTSAGSAPTMSAAMKEIEATATDANQCHYAVPAFSVSSKHHAQILFGAFALTGAGCTLTECSATVGCTVNQDKVAGVKIGSDANSGVITVTATILQTGSTKPTVTLPEGCGFVQTAPLTCSNPETAYKSWTCEFQRILTKTEPTGSGSSDS